MFGIAWLGTLWGRVAFYGVIIALALAMLRWYSNKAYNAGYDKGKVQGSEDMLKSHEKEWAEAQKQLDADKQQLVDQRVQLATDKNLSVQNRQAIVATLTKGQQQLLGQIQALTPQIAALPPSEVDGWIRKALQELR